MSTVLVIGCTDNSSMTLDAELVHVFGDTAASLGYRCEFEPDYAKGSRAAAASRPDAVLLYLAGNVIEPGHIILQLRSSVSKVIVVAAATARQNGHPTGYTYLPRFALRCRHEFGASLFVLAAEEPRGGQVFANKLVRVLTDDPNSGTQIEVSSPDRIRTAFIAMPYETMRRTEFQSGVEAALACLQWPCYIGDALIGQDSIRATVCEQIRKSDIMIANLTGAIGNVIFELGVGWEKDVILLRRAGDTAELPSLFEGRRILDFHGAVGLAQLLYEGLHPSCR